MGCGHGSCFYTSQRVDVYFCDMCLANASDIPYMATTLPKSRPLTVADCVPGLVRTRDVTRPFTVRAHIRTIPGSSRTTCSHRCDSRRWRSVCASTSLFDHLSGPPNQHIRLHEWREWPGITERRGKEVRPCRLATTASGCAICVVTAVMGGHIQAE